MKQWLQHHRYLTNVLNYSVDVWQQSPNGEIEAISSLKMYRMHNKDTVGSSQLVKLWPCITPCNEFNGNKATLKGHKCRQKVKTRCLDKQPTLRPPPPFLPLLFRDFELAGSICMAQPLKRRTLVEKWKDMRSTALYHSPHSSKKEALISIRKMACSFSVTSIPKQYEAKGEIKERRKPNSTLYQWLHCSSGWINYHSAG